MGRMVRDVVPVFDERVNLLGSPRLAFFEDDTEFVPLLWGELRRSAATDAWTKPLDATIVPFECLATRRDLSIHDASACLLACIS